MKETFSDIVSYYNADYQNFHENMKDKNNRHEILSHKTDYKLWINKWKDKYKGNDKLIDYPVIQMNLKENELDTALINLMSCVLPRMIDIWETVWETKHYSTHQCLNHIFAEIFSCFELFSKPTTDSINKKFIICQIYTATRPFIDFNLRRMYLEAALLRPMIYNFPNSTNFFVILEPRLDLEEAYLFLRTVVLKGRKIRYVLGKVLTAIGLFDVVDPNIIEESVKIMEEIEIKMVKNVGWAGMVGIDCIYISSTFGYTLNDLFSKKCQIAGTILHEFFNFIYRFIKQNFLIPTPKQKKTFFELGHFSELFLYGDVNLRYFNKPDIFLKKENWNLEKPLFNKGQILEIKDRGDRPYASGYSVERKHCVE